MTLTELADGVERLTEACRETDLAISVAINFKGVFDKDRAWKWSVMADDIEGHKDGKKSFLDPAQFVPRWTESLDAAMMLARNNREAMLMIHAAFGSFESDEMDGALNIFPRIKAMLLTNLRARAASENSHG